VFACSMIGRTLFVVLVILALGHVLAVGMDQETARARRAHHKTHAFKAAKHHATVRNQLKAKAHAKLLSYLKQHTSIKALTSSHVVAMDHAVSLMHKTFHQMKSALKNLRSHMSAKAKHGNKAGYVYADVVDSLDNYAPVCASLPYYMVTCSNCMDYVHHCLNCVYDKPSVVPTIVPEYLSNSYLPEYPSFPVYPVQEDQQEQQEQEPLYGESEQQEHGALPTAGHVRTLLDSLRSGLPTLEQGLYTIQTDIQKIQTHLPGGATEDNWPSPNDAPMTDPATLNNIAQHTDVGASGPHLNHILTIIKSIQSSLPEYQKDMQQLQADLSRCSRYEPSLMSEPSTSDPISF